MPAASAAKPSPLDLYPGASIEIAIMLRLGDGRSIEISRHAYEDSDGSAVAVFLREIAASKLADAAPAARSLTAPRSLYDRVAEALRREWHGLMRPLWPDLTAADRQPWLDRAPDFCARLGTLGLAIVESPAK